jgi:hypothetical protein
MESHVLHRLWDHIGNCYARAADARRRADEVTDPECKADLLLMEESWKRLAQSYELSEQLERSLLARSRNLSTRVDWQRAAVAPFDRVVELAVVGAAGIDAIGFPCRRVLKGWIAVESGAPLDVQPTHWREWNADAVAGTLRSPARRRLAARPAAQA